MGTAYTTSQEEFEGYTFAGMGPKTADPEGTVDVGTKTVIYLYDPIAPEPEQKTGYVDVKYVDENGVALPGGDLTVVKENAPVGEAYTTEKKSFEGYEFKGMDEMSSPVRGNVIEGEQHVIYVYAPIPEVKTGSVDVKYIDKETGEEITGGKLASVKENAPAGDTYTTEQKDFEGYTFSGMDVTSASANGSVVADTTLHVIYTYTKNPEPVIIKGSVDVKYITTDGETLEDISSVIDNEEVGTAYSTDEKTFEGYTFVGMDKTSAPASGSVIEGIQHVIYVYAPIPEVKTGSVDVTYMTEDGSILQQSIVKHNAPVDEAYETEQKSFEGYTFKEMDSESAPANGVVTEGIQHVIYIYTDDSSKNAPETGSVDVKYIADDGTVLKDTETVKDTAPAGEKYTTEQKDFAGYTFKGLDVTSAAANGQVIANETLHIIYVYEKNEAPKDAKGSVDVTYVTTDGKTLKDTEVVKDNVHVGTKYTTTEETFEGYTFVGMSKTSAPAEGSVIEGTQHVVYTYTAEKASSDPKQGDVVVYYIDENGTVLHSDIVKDHVNYGTDYSTDQLTFEGYTFKQMKEGSDPVKGKVNKALTTITYVYTQDVQNPPAPKPDIVPGTPEDETSGPEAVIQEILPKTADEMPITLALSLSSLALIGLGAIALRRKHLAEAAEHVEQTHE